MHPGEYLKEWTYKYCYLHDESIVRNFAERENPFMGRPQEMIHFKRGDIVMIPDDYAGHWGKNLYVVQPQKAGSPVRRDVFL